MIFSHVLYQLSYLARQQKTARAVIEARAGSSLGSPTYRPPAPTRLRGLHVSATVQDRTRDASSAERARPTRKSDEHSVSTTPPDHLNVGNAAKGGASGQ